jgi:hypothetical protein
MSDLPLFKYCCYFNVVIFGKDDILINNNDVNITILSPNIKTAQMRCTYDLFIELSLQGLPIKSIDLVKVHSLETDESDLIFQHPDELYRLDDIDDDHNPFNEQQ